VKIVVIGRGRVGRALSRALADDRSHDVVSMGRKLDRSRLAGADVTLVAVGDQEIAALSERIAPCLRAGAVVVHCAGARGRDELEPCSQRGAHVGVMHPLVSFPSTRRAPSLHGTTFVLSGDPKARSAARRIAKVCGARAIVADTTDPLYHAAAAFAANGAASLAFVAVGWLERLGIGRRAAERAVGGLLISVGENVRELGVPNALTGPVARGDVETVARHRRALRGVGRTSLASYDAVLPLIVDTARALGLPARVAKAMVRHAASAR